MSLSTHCIFQRASSPLVATAIHNGHDTREDVERCLALPEDIRLREEDPYTGVFAQVASTQIVGLRSRFEVDLNRPREHAVYLSPEDAWGLAVWKRLPDQSTIEASIEEYERFYESVLELLRDLVREHGRIVVYDLHTYNHRRAGPLLPAADEFANPEVNIGTGTMDRTFWGRVIDRFADDLRNYNFHGRSLDVRENLKFKGGHFGKWVHQTFPRQVCTIAIEVKKFFMDEWTGEADAEEVEAVYNALQSTVPGVLEE